MAAALCAATLLTLGAGSAAAAPGDAFYLSEKKNTFVSFAIRAGSNQVSDLSYTARRVRCTKGKPQTMTSLDRTVPIQENLLGEPFFEAFWALGHPSNGGIAGKIGDTNVKGELDLRINKSKKASCETGLRRWRAEPVSEEAWLAARAEQGYPEDGTP